ncbi:MAG: hypothetical protein GWN67_03660 [Phycisphaerae bacterium]|nr:hypothetical protein [Phycisphaerae bacterium]NIS50244.1 hypothetical protein [Phycisphaerae bacterium]NIU07908.1 hypothetical protein [Phycisphaerae bacterium]NIU55510.1 hypothetical protein [Phycisphaerae bacterium]NIU99879.1 hypothetical protein [Phycisphaerae bacterium]
MNCPKCGNQNPDDAELCTSCNSPLAQPPQPVETVKVKTSRLAITSMILAILSPFAFFLAVFFGIKMLALISIFAAMLALIFGIISLVRIGLSAGRRTGKAFVSIGIAILAVFFSLIFLQAVLPRTRSRAFRMVCGSNLAGLGRAMLIYANDYDNNYPRAGGQDTIWQPKINDWQAKDRRTAFFLKSDGTGGSATISSSLYLLVRYTDVSLKSFICKSGDLRAKIFNPAKYGVRDIELEDLWDFGPEPAKHYSYSYHIPYGPFPLNMTTSEPGQAVAADRNPWLDPYTDTTGFRWDDQAKTGPPEDIKRCQKGNNGFHQREGQNVLFMDNHVYFEKLPFCGVDDDNIYTYWNGSDIQQGAPPTLTSQPADRLDSLLVNEQPKEDKK